MTEEAETENNMKELGNKQNAVGKKCEYQNTSEKQAGNDDIEQRDRWGEHFKEVVNRPPPPTTASNSNNKQ